LDEAVPIFAALGDETRIRLAARLSADGPTSITKLTAGFDVTRQAITKHLRVMEQTGLARESRQGRESVWELQPGPLETAGRCLELISRQWDDALARLKDLVEE
jgi:DNA-binding transcriptional ArsR family regulator